MLDKILDFIEKSALCLGRLSFVLATLAFFPSIAPFTPALLISFFAFFGAMIGGLFGEIRLAILTLYIVIATFFVSPLSQWIEAYIDLGTLVKSLLITGIILAIGLHYHYRLGKNNSKS